MADTISESQILLASLQTLKVAENGQKGEDIAVGASFLSHSIAVLDCYLAYNCLKKPGLTESTINEALNTIC